MHLVEVSGATELHCVDCARQGGMHSPVVLFVSSCLVLIRKFRFSDFPNVTLTHLVSEALCSSELIFAFVNLEVLIVDVTFFSCTMHATRHVSF